MSARNPRSDVHQRASFWMNRHRAAASFGTASTESRGQYLCHAELSQLAGEWFRGRTTGDYPYARFRQLGDHSCSGRALPSRTCETARSLSAHPNCSFTRDARAYPLVCLTSNTSGDHCCPAQAFPCNADKSPSGVAEPTSTPALLRWICAGSTRRRVINYPCADPPRGRSMERRPSNDCRYQRPASVRVGSGGANRSRQ